MERAAWVVSLYETAAQFSSRMLDAASQGRWDELVELERQRDSVLSELKSDAAQAGIPPEATEAVKKAIGAILAADAETEALARAWQVELKGLLGSMNTERKLLDTYDN